MIFVHLLPDSNWPCSLPAATLTALPRLLRLFDLFFLLALLDAAFLLFFGSVLGILCVLDVAHVFIKIEQPLATAPKWKLGLNTCRNITDGPIIFWSCLMWNGPLHFDAAQSGGFKH